MHVTKTHLCFLGFLGSHGNFHGKKSATPLGSIQELHPAKRFALTPGNGHSLHVKTATQTLHFHGISERDHCLSLIESVCIAGGGAPLVKKFVITKAHTPPRGSVHH